MGTGKAPARTFEEQNEEAKMRPEVIEEVIKRTFGNSRAKTNGTGIWLRLVSKYSSFLNLDRPFPHPGPTTSIKIAVHVGP